MKSRKNNIITLTRNQQSKIDNIVNTNNNRSLINGCSNCGKTYVMNCFLLQKQEPVFIITKTINQYPNIRAQTSDEFQPLENYENSTVVLDDRLPSIKESNTDLFFTLGQHSNIDIYYTSH